MVSRYDSTNNIKFKNVETKGSWARYPWLIQKPADNLIRTLKINTNLANDARKIANQVYGDHELYWVIVAFNSVWYNNSGATNVFNWPASGQVIYYPLFSVISPTINN